MGGCFSPRSSRRADHSGMAGRRLNGLAGLQQAFDEVRFGAARTLNLRASLPTAREAATRLENWLRQQQPITRDELLVITGRGNNSDGGVAVVREAAIRVFAELQRKGVIKDYTEHTPGSFIVLPAPMSALADASRRSEPEPLPAAPTPPTLASLHADTRQLLRTLAERSLDALGVYERGPFVEDEMLRLFGTLAGTIKPGADRELALRDAITAAMKDYD
jgi:hypothetical protein